MNNLTSVYALKDDYLGITLAMRQGYAAVAKAPDWFLQPYIVLPIVTGVVISYLPLGPHTREAEG